MFCESHAGLEGHKLPRPMTWSELGRRNAGMFAFCSKIQNVFSTRGGASSMPKAEEAAFAFLRPEALPTFSRFGSYRRLRSQELASLSLELLPRQTRFSPCYTALRRAATRGKDSEGLCRVWHRVWLSLLFVLKVDPTFLNKLPPSTGVKLPAAALNKLSTEADLTSRPLHADLSSQRYWSSCLPWSCFEWSPSTWLWSRRLLSSRLYLQLSIYFSHQIYRTAQPFSRPGVLVVAGCVVSPRMLQLLGSGQDGPGG